MLFAGREGHGCCEFLKEKTPELEVGYSWVLAREPAENSRREDRRPGFLFATPKRSPHDLIWKISATTKKIKSIRYRHRETATNQDFTRRHSFSFLRLDFVGRCGIEEQIKKRICLPGMDFWDCLPGRYFMHGYLAHSDPGIIHDFLLFGQN